MWVHHYKNQAIALLRALPFDENFLKSLELPQCACLGRWYLRKLRNFTAWAGPAAGNGHDDDSSHWCDDDGDDGDHDPENGDDGDFEQIWAALENILFLFSRQDTISVCAAWYDIYLLKIEKAKCKPKPKREQRWEQDIKSSGTGSKQVL